MPSAFRPAAIALGSNLDDRRSHLDYAVSRLRPALAGLRASTWRETEPVGVGDQPRFLNGAVVGCCSLPARDLLGLLLAIERERGRERPYPGAPRTLDLDLILVGEEILDEPDLVVPHPRFRERLFVLDPLAEIAPRMIDPVTGRLVVELREEARRAVSSKQ